MDKKGVVRTVSGGTCAVYLYDEKRDVSVSIHNVDPGEPVKQDKVTCTSRLTSYLQLTLLVPPSISGGSPTLIAEPFFLSLFSNLFYLSRTLHESSKIFVEHALHVARRQFRTQA